MSRVWPELNMLNKNPFGFFVSQNAMHFEDFDYGVRSFS